ncbi:PH domain-containing protein [Shewanella fidelis]|uniref:PH domain-containing protein n=1 Tax=Shewanella fidelis TaxID=173509 RepID=A0AAW8NJX2_9GAMM|nr:PH domain-containing protein [Shewanella fidelis]MDR8522600.1 PH domain-containing protein [Shewanella fidelis]MDW4812216.1 PH domain-containing protein [Shewanella fidelis]MDW4816120.1 PH domain-containing protein [Shewanella fidelis]MDW4820457.1 PH domain-containing protein [Shewanella fidelis]MDW4824679.1 PH domain-containing protein [Shewanella fidelis]
MTTAKFSQWSPLSPWSIISFTLLTAKQLLSSGYAIIPVVYTGWKQGFNSPWVIVAVVAVIGVILLFSVLNWLKFRFKIASDKLIIRHGIIFKKADELPFTKIQNVRLEQPLYFRPMGLYRLIVETAGSKENEAELSALTYKDALSLKKHLMAEHDAQLTRTDGINHHDVSDSHAKQVHTLSRKNISELVLFGLYQNNAIWLAVILGPIFGQLDWESVESLQLVQAFLTWYDNNIAVSILLQLVFASLALILFYLLFSILSIASAVLKYFPYKLSRSGNTLHRTGGIIAKQNDALAIKRIQVIKFYQPLVGRLLKLWTLYFKQVKGHEVENQGNTNMLIPSMTRTEISSLLPELKGIEASATVLPTDYQRIHMGWFWRRGLLPFIVPAVNSYFLGLNVITDIMWLAAGLFSLGIYLKYRQYGYVIEGDDLWFHSGLLGHSWQLIALSKVQHVAISQSPNQQRSGLANLEIGLASGTVKLPYISVNAARDIAERSLALIHNDHRNWI